MDEKKFEQVKQILDAVLDIFVEAALVGGYILLVFKGVASVEGFIVIATYIIKKKYDMKDEKQLNGGGTK